MLAVRFIHVQKRFGLLAVAATILLSSFSIGSAEPDSMWSPKLDNQWGGHFKVDGSAVNYDDESFYGLTDTGTGYDGLVNLRLTDTLFLSEKVYAEAHYEAFLEWGDTYEKHYELRNQLPGGVIIDKSDMDKRRLFDLTKVIKETENYMLWNRLDRLFVSVNPSWGDVSIGRQAVTWGNGLIFNPMDLFNPFSPSDTDRDYKTGDDLVSIRFNTDRFGEFNVLYVPRRDLFTNHVDKDSSSYAGKVHFFAGTSEVDLMCARHYGENVAGIGGSGYLADAAWRADMTWSTLSRVADKSGYLNFVANLDYSWVWRGKNMYGLIEYYHNGLGEDDYDTVFSDPEIVERLARGEMFTIGRDYVSGMVQLELHPLFNLYLSLINNIHDPSGIIQPRAIWSMSQNSTLNFGVNTYYGKKGTEFGGVIIPGTGVYTTAPESAYLLLTAFF